MRASTQPGIEDLYREHALGLVRFALLLTGDRATAEDVVQDAFLGLHRHWDEIKDPGRVLAYLRTAVINGSRSRHRRHMTARRLRPEPLTLVQSAEASVLAGEYRRALLAAVGALPRRQREVLALKYFLDLGEQEIAAILHISRGAVASTASRALTTLARQLREDREES
jgi:RNA polymerase sigma-70 factor (sigma-E family)